MTVRFYVAMQKHIYILQGYCFVPFGESQGVNSEDNFDKIY